MVCCLISVDLSRLISAMGLDVVRVTRQPKPLHRLSVWLLGGLRGGRVACCTRRCRRIRHF